MAIYTRWGNEIEVFPVNRPVDASKTLTVRARRLCDGTIRVYDIWELKADGGIHEVVAALEGRKFTEGGAR